MQETLTKEERSRITDGAHKIQSASVALSGVDHRKIPDLEGIESCLEDADKTLRSLLRDSRPPKPHVG
jgi:hypothetical protein